MSIHTFNQNIKVLSTCGSTINGHRAELLKIDAFSDDIRSFGRPSLFHVAICVSSVSKESGSRLSVFGISG